LGCGVAALAGFSCDWIANAVLALYALFAIAILFVVAKFSKPGRLVRNEVIGLAVFVSPFIWAHFKEAERLDLVRAQWQEAQALCYERALERVWRPARNLTVLVVSPPSAIRDVYGTELFYGSSSPDRWTARKTVRNIAHERVDGAYELRYTYLPETREVGGAPVTFRGVHQQVFDLGNKELIAERINFQWGNNFLRGGYCLPSGGLTGWYDGNDEFLDRVVGNKYEAPGGKETQRRGTPKSFAKATLIGQDNVNVTLANQDLKPEGTKDVVVGGIAYEYNYYHNPPRVQVGAIPAIVGYMRNGIAPANLMSMTETADGYMVVALPDGGVRNRPPLSVLFVFLSKEVEERGRVYAQIPPGIQWTDGWGFDAKDVVLSEKTIRFSIYGAKKRTGKYSDQGNEGQYLKRYTLSVERAT
jgi:hypothetical protein